jgi:diguanylate cyclase (GGDEF)-like protein
MNNTYWLNFLGLAVLFVVFRFIVSGDRTRHLRLCLAGWLALLVHFFAARIDSGMGPLHPFMLAVSMTALELAGISFVLSFVKISNEDQRKLALGALLGICAILYVNATIWEASSNWFYYGIICVGIVGTILLRTNFLRQVTLPGAGVLVICLTLTSVMILVVTRGEAALGDNVIVATTNVSAGVLYWKYFRHWTPGVITGVLGFLAWGAISILGIHPNSNPVSLSGPSEVAYLPTYFVAVGMMLTCLERQLEEREYLAYHDALTGAPNRRLLADRLAQALARATRNSNKVALLMIDLDDFKAINDRFGHSFGDLMLRNVVDRLTGSIRRSDTLARIGGDEFVVVSDVSDSTGAKALASHLKSTFSIPLTVQKNPIQIGISVGTALYPDDGVRPDELWAVADAAMYLSKRSGPIG